MSDDLLITPGSRKMEFKDSSANIDAKIETDASGNLKITNAGGDIEIEIHLLMYLLAMAQTI